jgi:hypothetical protein
MNELPIKPVPPKKPFWPWVLVSFSPAVFFAIEGFIFRPFSRGFTPIFLAEATYAFGFILAFLFFRFREKERIVVSLFYSFCVGLIILVLNVILFVSVFFIGCLCVMGGGRIAP